MLLHDDVHFVLSIVFDVFGGGGGDLKQKLDKGDYPKNVHVGGKVKVLVFLLFFSDLVFLVCLTSTVFIFSEIRKWFSRAKERAIKAPGEKDLPYDSIV